jgi:hypothetical protein
MFDLKYYAIIKDYDNYCNDLNDYSKMTDVLKRGNMTTKGLFSELAVDLMYKHNISHLEYNYIALNRYTRNGYFNNIAIDDTTKQVLQNCCKYSIKA